MDLMQENAIPTLYSEAEITERVAELAQEIAANLQGELMVISLLRGSFMFTADLVRELSRIGVHPIVDFMTLSSYGAGTQSSGSVELHRDVAEEVEGKHVLIVDDIIETGHTLAFAIEQLREKGAASLKVCMLLDKTGKLEKEVKADYIGFRIPDRFVVGYGLDYAGHYRELPYIGVLDMH